MLGQVDEGLVWFDGRQFWQISSGFVCVAGTGTDAFILNYFTPTVGLSCRSGGYLIFNVVALGLLVSELVVWIWASPIRSGHRKGSQGFGISNSNHGAHALHTKALASSRLWFARSLHFIERLRISVCTSIITHIPL